MDVFRDALNTLVVIHRLFYIMNMVLYSKSEKKGFNDWLNHCLRNEMEVKSSFIML